MIDQIYPPYYDNQEPTWMRLVREEKEKRENKINSLTDETIEDNTDRLSLMFPNISKDLLKGEIKRMILQYKEDLYELQNLNT